MKRYWKIISICFVTLLVIGTFYIQSSFATSEHLTVEFEKTNGNEDEVQNLMLYGDYLVDHNSWYQQQIPLQMTSEETIDPTNLSFLQKLSRLGIPYPLEKLVEKHKNFMRSKDLEPNYFFEDEHVVAYAQIRNPYERPMKDLTFEIEVLHKQSDEITAIQLEIPEKENYGWMNVDKVQVIDSELKVITRGFRIGGRDELRVYTFDLDEQKLVSHHTIASTPRIENGWSNLRIINDDGNNYLLIKIETIEDDMGHSDGKPNAAYEFIVYDIVNNQSKKIVGSDELLGSIGSASIFNSTLFISSQSSNGVEINQYDIKNDKWGTKPAFDLGDAKTDESPYMKAMNGKLYLIYATTNGHTLFIGDVETGESLYEGQLKVKNKGEDQKDYRLYFNRIEFVQ
ncbi:hypothetical protein ACFPRA_13340 [Sporosarcina soli]|uniref:Uncharacterized protein n=1 Tax=Sporosarcina soli TaxID=334736 RepID=A0ABW0TLR3_9BACL